MFFVDDFFNFAVGKSSEDLEGNEVQIFSTTSMLGRQLEDCEISNEIDSVTTVVG